MRGRRRVQRRARTKALLRAGHCGCDSVRGRSCGTFVAGFDLPGRRGPIAGALGGTRRSGTRGPKRIEFYGAWIRRARGGGKLLPRAYRGVPVEDWRDRLGADIWKTGRAVVSYRRDFLRAVCDDSGSDGGSDAGGEAARNSRFLRLELPRFALEITRREKTSAGSQPADCATRGRHAGKRGGLFGGTG